MAHFHVIAGADQTPAHPAIRKIGFAEVWEALRRGFDDFRETPSHVLFICLIYPLAGVCLAAFTSNQNELYLLYPLVTGFALLGPFAAIGIYELSRRRERGLEASWTDAFRAIRTPAAPSILALGLLLCFVFIAWLATAQALYQHLYGETAPQSYARFLADVVSTPRGWTLILAGNALGFVFAAAVFILSVISFPLLMDRDVGAAVAVETSVRAVWKNPLPMALWAAIVAMGLAIGLLSLLVGLILVMPILGHATWRLYRTIAPPEPI